MPSRHRLPGKRVAQIKLANIVKTHWNTSLIRVVELKIDNAGCYVE